MQSHAEIIHRFFPDAEITTAEIKMRPGRATISNYELNLFWNAIRKYTVADMFVDPRLSPECECTPLMYTIDLATKPITATLFTSIDHVPALVLAGLKQQFDDSRKYCVFLVPSDPPKLLDSDQRFFLKETDIESIKSWQEIIPVNVPHVDNRMLPRDEKYRHGIVYNWSAEVSEGFDQFRAEQALRRRERMMRLAAIGAGVALNMAIHRGDKEE